VVGETPMSKLLVPDHPTAKVRPSPNFGERKDGKIPDAIVLHYTGMASGPLAEDWLCNVASGVSSHYLVHEDGRIVQMVPEAARAWHAGASFWAGETDMNSRSIGIEVVNPGHGEGNPANPAAPFADCQIEAVIALCRGIADRWPIMPERVLAHSDIAPGRKIDPGELFPWAKLHRAGVGHYVPPTQPKGGRFFARGDSGQPVEALQSMLVLYGYDCPISGVFDAKTETVVTAFQRHFRPARIDGVADFSTIDTLHRLLSSVRQAMAVA
jgi:N-acetylmuramoyl-L-alanine amidase